MTHVTKKTYCFVPGCRSSSSFTPNKLFFYVPKGESRKLWNRAVGRDEDSLSLKTPIRCCEDHFQLEQDTDNWLFYKAVKNANPQNVPPLRLKKDVLPHLLLPPDRIQPVEPFIDHQPMELVFEDNLIEPMIEDHPIELVLEDPPIEPVIEDQPMEPVLEDQPIKPVNNIVRVLDHESLENYQFPDGFNENLPPDVILIIGSSEEDSPESSIQQYEDSIQQISIENGNQMIAQFQLEAESSSNDENQILEENEIFDVVNQSGARKRTPKGVPKKRSKSAQTKIKMRSQFTQTSPCTEVVFLRPTSENKTARAVEKPGKERRQGSSSEIGDSQSSEVVASQTSDSSYKPESESSPTESSQETFNELTSLQLKSVLPPLNVSVMERNPKLYLGLSKDKFGLVNIFAEYTKCDRRDILITLRKIKKNECYEELGDVFGLSKGSISTAINETVPKLALGLSSFIFWPSSKVIQSNLPSTFRIKYANVESILDCFEVNIQKPSDPVLQALTWSDYKKHNTIKYLISSTPSGLINFVSKGFGGRATDTEIVKESGFLNLLRPGTAVMADRGFKNIAALVTEKGCSLVHPPSVSKNKKLSKNKARSAKIIACLRIHIERVIERVREFKFLNDVALHLSLVHIANQSIVIVCALVNTQGPIIR